MLATAIEKYTAYAARTLRQIESEKRAPLRVEIAIIERPLFCYDAENVTAEARTSSEPPEASPVHSQSQQQSSQQQPPQQPHQQQQAAAQQYREAQVPRPSQQPSTPEKPAWGYGLDLIGSQASAFWQNYQGQSLSAARYFTLRRRTPFSSVGIRRAHDVPTESRAE